jgi:serine/threonine protein kinase
MPGSKQLPEPYLWQIFRGLAEVLHVCQTGLTVPKNHPTHNNKTVNIALPTVDGWRPIVNPDIKLGNVVLGQALPEHYPAYKIAKMIDFGLAFNDNRYNTAASKRAQRIGTEGLCPPASHILTH